MLKHRVMLVAAVGLVFALTASVQAVTYTWTGPTAGAANWNNPANWGGAGFPNAIDDVADLTMDITGALTINLGQPITIGTLIDADNDAAVGPNPLVITGDSLTFNVSAGNATWTHSPAGDATVDIAAPVLLDDSIDIYNDRGAYNGRMLVGGSITAASGGLKEILYNGLTGAGGGQPYIRIGGAISDGPGQLGVTMQSTSTSSGPGLYLDNAGNSYTGQTKNISAGSSDLIISTSGSLGNTSATTVTGGNGNAMLWLRASVSGKDVTISGQGWAGGSLFNGRNVCNFTGKVTLVGDARIGAGAYGGCGADFTLDVPSGNAIEGDFDLTFNPVHGPITVNDPIATGPGGLTKQGSNLLTLNALNTYTGDTFVTAGTLSTSVAYLDDASSVDIASGALMDLNFTGNDVIAGLTLGGVAQGVGIYNSTSDPTYFTGTGSLQVIPEPVTMALLGIGGLGVILRRKRR